MGQVLIKAAGCIVCIALGIFGKKLGLFRNDEKETVKKLVLNVTLPAVVISTFGASPSVGRLWWLIVWGLCANLIALSVGWLIGRRKSPADAAFIMIATPGYNIGAFMLPFVQTFLGAEALVATCLFDMGNSVMCTGGTFALTRAKVQHLPIRPKVLWEALKTSAPFLVYMSMLAITLVGIRIPAPVAQVAGFIGQANAFLAMLMIGLMFEIKADGGYFQRMIGVVAARLSLAAVFSLSVYFLLPAELLIRQVLAVLAFSPIPSIVPVFVGRCGGEEGLAGFAASVTILISLGIVTGLVVLFGWGG